MYGIFGYVADKEIKIGPILVSAAERLTYCRALRSAGGDGRNPAGVGRGSSKVVERRGRARSRAMG